MQLFQQKSENKEKSFMGSATDVLLQVVHDLGIHKESFCISGVQCEIEH
jgi:hypothetical protein